MSFSVGKEQRSGKADPLPHIAEGNGSTTLYIAEMAV
jgi:hypothetical protein